jgi:glycosyltransferase involved in cell wall biosynthesis
MALTIGIDASCWTNRRGYGRYTRELLRAILDLDAANQYWLFLDADTAAQSPDLPQHPRVRRIVAETSQAAAQAASAGGHRSLGDLWAMARTVHRHGRELDLFYFPSVYTFFPIRARAPVIVTIHDTIPERYPAFVFPDWRSRVFWTLKVRLALRRADLIVTVSDASRRELTRQFGIPDSRVRVVPDAAGDGFHPLGDRRADDRLAGRSHARDVLARYGLDAGVRFLLYVGGISPHKNLAVLVEAYAALLDRSVAEDIRLVIVGDFQKDVFFSGYSAIRDHVDRLGLAKGVVFTGFVPDDELPHLYSAAVALVLPSLAEGFGLPAIEAMACGTPVVASRAGALPEVVGDAGLLFDPMSQEQLTACLARLLADGRLRDEMRQRGISQAAKYSWRRSARAALALFEETARRG